MSAPLTANDLRYRHRSWIYTQTEGTSGAGFDARLTGGLTVFSMLLVCNDGDEPATLIINDALTVAGGGTTVTLKALTNTMRRFSFEPNGIHFDTGLSWSIDQAGAETVVISAMVTYIPD